MNKEQKNRISAKAKEVFEMIAKAFPSVVDGSSVDHKKCPNMDGSGNCICAENLMAIVGGLGVYTSYLGTKALNEDVLSETDLAFVDELVERGIKAETMTAAMPKGVELMPVTKELAEGLIDMLKRSLDNAQAEESKTSDHDVSDPNIQ